MIFRILNYKAHVKKAILPALILTIMFSIGSAWSYENSYTRFNYDVSREASLKSSPPSSTELEVCKSLLKTNIHTPAKSNISRKQRKAGKIAAFGIILGARFALEPKNTTHAQSPQKLLVRQNNKIDISPRSALSIAAYRNCQKEYILSKVARINKVRYN